jgi:hypothetical protein
LHTVYGARLTDFEALNRIQFLDVHLDPADRSTALQRLSDALEKRVKKKPQKIAGKEPF